MRAGVDSTLTKICATVCQNSGQLPGERPNLGDGPNITSESNSSKAKFSELVWPSPSSGIELSEFLPAFVFVC